MNTYTTIYSGNINNAPDGQVLIDTPDGPWVMEQSGVWYREDSAVCKLINAICMGELKREPVYVEPAVVAYMKGGYCPKCAAWLLKEWSFCVKCGIPITFEKPVELDAFEESELERIINELAQPLPTDTRWEELATWCESQSGDDGLRAGIAVVKMKMDEIKAKHKEQL